MDRGGGEDSERPSRGGGAVGGFRGVLASGVGSGRVGAPGVRDEGAALLTVFCDPDISLRGSD